MDLLMRKTRLPRSKLPEKIPVLLTSRAKNYVDVRVYNTGPEFSPTLPTDPNDSQAINQLEWAFAGQSKSTPAEVAGRELKKPAHTIWSHWIDSKTLDEVKDEGDMYPQEDGSVLEKGAMAHPGTGLITDYEEVWQDLEPAVTGDDKTRYCYVFTLDAPSSEARGMMIRIGDHIEGVMRVGTEITAIRLQWIQDKDETRATWHKTLSIGEGIIPCERLFAGGNGDLQEGKSVVTETGMSWVCMEAFSF